MADSKSWLQMPDVHQINWKRWGLVGGGLALAVMAVVTLTIITVVIGTPLLVVGGGAILLASPLILFTACCTAPLWIPLLLFVGIPALIFLLVTGGLTAVVAISAVTASVGLWWVYRYYKGPMPFGGHQVEYVQRRVGDTMKGVINKFRSK
ncbi:hypothetical protein CBR_g44500 [Chara braunii]|uniref:Oleosin n=1 Tax=Chara braunii TaxID=69332 RepID=A0A388LXR6_CHABU|nr:hypothetical protein CBR_g44500 [Chara braunii]|eukprot:GBG87043.1 hypothetical protein CBR_g44500 [Chara braunii]